MMLIAVLLLCVLIAVTLMSAQSSFTLKVEDVMTPQELKNTGISGLTSAQRKSFNEWLGRYTAAVYNVATGQSAKEANPRQPVAKNGCVPAVESNIDGDFNGWEGETVFKLDNGQIWEQAEYSYTYSYSYRPEVTIYQAGGGCRMKVEDEDETIMVRRIK
jgi:hypothetical protein